MNFKDEYKLMVQRRKQNKFYRESKKKLVIALLIVIPTFTLIVVPSILTKDAPQVTKGSINDLSHTLKGLRSRIDLLYTEPNGYFINYTNQTAKKAEALNKEVESTSNTYTKLKKNIIVTDTTENTFNTSVDTMIEEYDKMIEAFSTLTLRINTYKELNTLFQQPNVQPIVTGNVVSPDLKIRDTLTTEEFKLIRDRYQTQITKGQKGIEYNKYLNTIIGIAQAQLTPTLKLDKWVEVNFPLSIPEGKATDEKLKEFAKLLEDIKQENTKEKYLKIYTEYSKQVDEQVKLDQQEAENLQKEQKAKEAITKEAQAQLETVQKSVEQAQAELARLEAEKLKVLQELQQAKNDLQGVREGSQAPPVQAVPETPSEPPAQTPPTTEESQTQAPPTSIDGVVD